MWLHGACLDVRPLWTVVGRICAFPQFKDNSWASVTEVGVLCGHQAWLDPGAQTQSKAFLSSLC